MNYLLTFLLLITFSFGAYGQNHVDSTIHETALIISQNSCLNCIERNPIEGMTNVNDIRCQQKNVLLGEQFFEVKTFVDGGEFEYASVTFPHIQITPEENDFIIQLIFHDGFFYDENTKYQAVVSDKSGNTLEFGIIHMSVILQMKKHFSKK